MRTTTLIVLTVWASFAQANELLPELPFQAVDGNAIVPYQEGMTGDQNSPINPDHPIQMSKDIVNGPPNMQDQIQQSAEQAEPSEPSKAPEFIPKPKERPKILAQAPETTHASANNKQSNRSLPSGVTIIPKPGRTENIIIAKSKLNRIVTSYVDPKVLTVDNVETKIDGSAVYIATDSKTPVSLFISDSETGRAASLQLTPVERMAPVEIRIEQDTNQSSLTEAASSKTDKLFRQDSPYVMDITAIMQYLGKQLLPQGFTLQEGTEELPLAAICHSKKLTFIPSQLLSGHEVRIIIMVAQNNDHVARVIEETTCANENVMAVAAWPKIRLEPGEKTEIFILLRWPETKSGEDLRPALL